MCTKHRIAAIPSLLPMARSAPASASRCLSESQRFCGKAMSEATASKDHLNHLYCLHVVPARPLRSAHIMVKSNLFLICNRCITFMSFIHWEWPASIDSIVCMHERFTYPRERGRGPGSTNAYLLAVADKVHRVASRSQRHRWRR